MTPRNDAQLELELAIRQALDAIEARLDSQDKAMGELNKRVWALERTAAKMAVKILDAEKGGPKDHEIN